MSGRTIGNLILMTLVCVIIFWVFMALRPARAGELPRFETFPNYALTCEQPYVGDRITIQVMPSAWTVKAQSDKGGTSTYRIARAHINVRQAINRHGNPVIEPYVQVLQLQRDGSGHLIENTGYVQRYYVNGRMYSCVSTAIVVDDAPPACDSPPYGASEPAYKAIMQNFSPGMAKTIRGICIAKYVDGPERQDLLTRFKFTTEQITGGDVADLTVATIVRLWNILHDRDALDDRNADQDPFRKGTKP
jgi:hypothetical protein